MGERVWDGRRFAITHYDNSLHSMSKFQVWDKRREIHVRTFWYGRGEDKEDARKRAVECAKELDKEKS